MTQGARTSRPARSARQPRSGGTPGDGRAAPSRWRLTPGAGSVALLGLLLAGVFGAITVFEDLPGARLAAQLERNGVTVTVQRAREHIGRGKSSSHRDAVAVTFTVSGQPVSARLANVSRETATSYWFEGWRPATGEYAEPLEVTYDPADPSRVMATIDVGDQADGDRVRTGAELTALSAGAGLGIGALIWLVGVRRRGRHRSGRTSDRGPGRRVR